MKKLSLFAAALLLLGAGCSSSSSSTPSTGAGQGSNVNQGSTSPSRGGGSAASVESVLGIELPDDADVSKVTDVAGNYLVKYTTETSPQNSARSLDEQFRADGFAVRSAPNFSASGRDNDEIGGTYQKTINNVPATISFTIEIDGNRTEVSIVRSGAR